MNKFINNGMKPIAGELVVETPDGDYRVRNLNDHAEDVVGIIFEVKDKEIVIMISRKEKIIKVDNAVLS